VLIGASHCDLLKQGAHVLGVACRESPTRVVSLMLEVADGGQALTPNCVALVSDESKATAVPSRPGR
jgi:hypothetical protein